jgi:hypothetical protein
VPEPAVEALAAVPTPPIPAVAPPLTPTPAVAPPPLTPTPAVAPPPLTPTLAVAPPPLTPTLAVALPPPTPTLAVAPPALTPTPAALAAQVASANTMANKLALETMLRIGDRAGRDFVILPTEVRNDVQPIAAETRDFRIRTMYVKDIIKLYIIHF